MEGALLRVCSQEVAVVLAMADGPFVDCDGGGGGGDDDGV